MSLLEMIVGLAVAAIAIMIASQFMTDQAKTYSRQNREHAGEENLSTFLNKASQLVSLAAEGSSADAYRPCLAGKLYSWDERSRPSSSGNLHGCLDFRLVDGSGNAYYGGIGTRCVKLSGANSTEIQAVRTAVATICPFDCPGGKVPFPQIVKDDADASKTVSDSSSRPGVKGAGLCGALDPATDTVLLRSVGVFFNPESKGSARKVESVVSQKEMSFTTEVELLK